MSKIAYEPRRFTTEASEVIATAEAICAEYNRQGYKLTLRALYYQFIRRDAFPESRRNAAGTKNHQQNYKWLSDLVSNARIAGLVDWSHIEDPTRESAGGDGGWSSPASAVASITDWYSIPRWVGQANYVEVWVEKEALLEVVRRPASRWNVRYMACKGSPSQTAVHDAALRLRSYERQGRKTEIIYLGDHDPTGLDIPRDIQDRLVMYGSEAYVDRIALNMDQITPDLPPSPAKLTDSRAGKYIDQFGTDTWDQRAEREERERRVLTALSDNWAEVETYMRDEGMVDES